MTTRKLLIAAAVATSALLVPTPSVGAAEDTCGTLTGKGCAPPSARVDLERPTFSDPTHITNPLFPISALDSVVLLGNVGKKAFRSETTLLPGTLTVDWDGEPIEVLVSQYVAWTDGLIEEMALDRYAQADDGSVWYFGEDVYDYVDGRIAISEGTWLAGRDGPPAMIMPAHPEPGQVFRAENVPGVVFEEQTVRKVDQTVDGPSGKVAGAVTMDELHVDGVSGERKTFAPGYGEFRTSGDGDLEALAVAHGTDVREGPTPTALRHIVTTAWGALENVRLHDKDAARANARTIKADRAAIADLGLPPRVASALGKAAASLDKAVGRRDWSSASRAATNVAESALDLELLYQPALAVDIERFHLHAQRLRIAAADKSTAGVASETSALTLLVDRISGHLEPAVAASLEARMSELRTIEASGNRRATADAAARTATWLRSAS